MISLPHIPMLLLLICQQRPALYVPGKHPHESSRLYLHLADSPASRACYRSMFQSDFYPACGSLQVFQDLFPQTTPYQLFFPSANSAIYSMMIFKAANTVASEESIGGETSTTSRPTS